MSRTWSTDHQTYRGLRGETERDFVANRGVCENFLPVGLWRGCRCLIPLKQINERSTNSDGGMRGRPRGRTGGRCVLAGESSVKSIHALLNQWNPFSLSLFFHIFLFPSDSLSLSPSSGYSFSLCLSASFFYGFDPSLALHSSCPACHGLMSVMS